MTRSIFLVFFIFILGGWYIAETKRSNMQEHREKLYRDSLKQVRWERDTLKGINKVNKGFLDTLNKVLHEDHRYENWKAE